MARGAPGALGSLVPSSISLPSAAQHLRISLCVSDFCFPHHSSFSASDPPVSLLVVTWSHPDRPEESHIKVLTSKSHHVCKVPFAIAGNTFWGCEGSHYSANHTNSGQLTRHNNDDEVDIDDGDDKDGAMMMKMVMLIKMVL